MSCFASFSAFGSRLEDAPAEARESMSDHFEVEGREGAESHFLRRDVLSDASGRRSSRCAAEASVRKGSWEMRMSVWKWSRRRRRERLWRGVVSGAIVRLKGGRMNILEMGVQGPLDIDLLAALVAALEQLKVAGNGLPLGILHLPRPLVADPSVGASTARVDPQDVLEAKVLAQSHVHDLDGHCDPLPAQRAYLGALAAGADGVVVGHVDIKHQLLLHGAEHAALAHRLAVARVCAVDGPDFEARGDLLHALLAEHVGRGEGLVAQVGVVGQGEGELAVGEGGRGDGGVVQPLEEEAEGKEALVELAHRLVVDEGARRFGGCCRL
jgi:hypothetical protein